MYYYMQERAHITIIAKRAERPYNSNTTREAEDIHAEDHAAVADTSINTEAEPDTTPETGTTYAQRAALLALHVNPRNTAAKAPPRQPTNKKPTGNLDISQKRDTP